MPKIINAQKPARRTRRPARTTTTPRLPYFSGDVFGVRYGTVKAYGLGDYVRPR